MVRVGIIGCGLITTRKYIPIFKRLKGRATIAGICDLDKRILHEVATRFGIARAYTDVFQMIEETQPEIVVVCTPPATHPQVVIAALERQAHVLVEKPMALTVEKCQEMVDAARRHGRALGVMHNQVFNPAFEQACHLVATGCVGRFLGMRIFLMTSLHDMTTNPNHWAHRLPGGVVGETGPHAVYLSLALLDRVRDVHVCQKKQLAAYPWSIAEDIRFDLIADNGISSVALMYGSNQSAAEVEIIGTEGMLKVDLQSRILVNHNRAVGPELLTAKVIVGSILGNIYQTGTALMSNIIQHGWSKTLDGHYVGISRFLDHIENGTEYRATGDKANETAEVLAMVVEKLQQVENAEGKVLA